MMELILGFAEKDERIRAVLIAGSRVNDNIERDVFQDYDIDCIVTDVEPFRYQAYVVPRFGETILVEKPEDHVYSPGNRDGSYNYNMQFVDGNRIDLSFVPLDLIQDRLKDSLNKAILDKDGLLADMPPPSEKSHFIKPPTAHTFADCCECHFFNLGPHIPKTFWRRQLPLLKTYVRYKRNMLEWEIGTKKGHEINLGASGKRLEKHLEPEVWKDFQQTYASASYEETRKSILMIYKLFKRAA